MNFLARIGEARYLIALLVLTLMLSGIMWFSWHDVNFEMRNALSTSQKGWTLQWVGYFNFTPRVKEFGPVILIDSEGEQALKEAQETAIRI